LTNGNLASTPNRWG